MNDKFTNVAIAGWRAIYSTETAPNTGESDAEILKDLDEIIVPGLTHWQSPNFFAFFPTGISAPSILGELISAGKGSSVGEMKRDRAKLEFLVTAREKKQ